MTSTTLPPRSYRGMSQADRQQDRRSRLIEAAIAVYGERGYRQASVKAVCEAAGLTERYFYESFANSDELLVTSFNAVTMAVRQQSMEAARNTGSGATQAERARAMLHAYYACLRDEPHSARVFLVEIRGVSAAVDAAFELALRAIAREITPALGLRGKGENALLQLAVLGGVIQLATSWVNQGYAPSIDDVTDTALQLVRVLFEQ